MASEAAVQKPAVDERRKGEAPIKKEFVRPPRERHHETAGDKPTPSAEGEPQTVTNPDESATATAGVKRPADEVAESGADAPKSKRRRGMNKKRGPSYSQKPAAQRLCPLLSRCELCLYAEECRFSHDVAAFMAEKPADLDGECPVFKEVGKCHFGLSCRFAKSHLSAAHENKVDMEVLSKYRPTTENTLSKELQSTLRHRRYDFTRADENVRRLDDRRDAKPVQAAAALDSTESLTCNASEPCPPEIVESSAAPETAEASAPPVKTVGCLTDEDLIKPRPAEKKTVDFSDKLYLAPLTTVGNLPFRRICKRFGADITCGEMALATQLLQGQTSEWALVKRHECEDIFGVQIAGAFPDTMTRCAQLLQETCQLDFIDINVGCPIDLIFKKGAGCALMSRTRRFQSIVTSVASVMDIPLSVKMRTGVYDRNWNAHELLPKLYDWGASLVTLHGRSREQRYTRQADWDYIGRCATMADGRYFYGNGDILSYEDFEASREMTGLSGVMLARGALIKPWVFTEIKERRHWDISSSERFDILKDFTRFGLSHWGSDSKGVESTRRFILEWLSFLHRYIPVGILEVLPQHINDRPAPYFGRDDMETLMASDNCIDWVKISEMLLGPVSDGFSFIPKHRANSYPIPVSAS